MLRNLKKNWKMCEHCGLLLRQLHFLPNNALVNLKPLRQLTLRLIFFFPIFVAVAFKGHRITLATV